MKLVRKILVTAVFICGYGSMSLPYGESSLT